MTIQELYKELEKANEEGAKKFGVISNSCTQQVTGSYDVDENGIAQPC